MKYFLELSYNGTAYHGWQNQPNAISVQQVLEEALTLLLKENVAVVGAGRTDAGVHASQMYAHFDIENEFNTVEIIYKINALLPNDIVIYNIIKTTKEAHARFDALSRSYEYRIFLGRNPFEIDTTWQLNNKKLNVDKMNEAAEILLTYTNFKCFSRSNTDVKTYNCNISNAEWILTDKLLVFNITADRFLRNMVRAIVGTLLDIGCEKTSIATFKNIIESKNRCNAGASAPPQGLFLMQIKYPKTIFIHE